MTTSLALNANNDIYIGADGNLATVTGIDAAIQNCKTAMQAQQGEMMYAMLNGMPTRATVWDNFNPSLFEAAGRSILAGVQDVTGVAAFTITRTENVLTYTAVIVTIYGTGTVSNSFPIG